MKTIDKYFGKKSKSDLSPPKRDDCTRKKSRVEIDVKELPFDPGLRTRIMDYHPDDRDKIRREYWNRGPCQPREHNFPQKIVGKLSRRFNPIWFNEFSVWLEYSIAKDAAYFLCCYLFKVDIGDQSGGESFVSEGFSNWKKKNKLQEHIGGVDSAHNKALSKCLDLMNQEKHIGTSFFKQSDQARTEYRVRLNASVDCIWYLLRQGLPFLGNDESEDSDNQGNFLELLHFLDDHNEDVKAVVLKNAPENLKLTSPEIQKQIVHAAANETLKVIIQDIGDEQFSILVDESRDVSSKEQMAVALRYVDKKGHIIEHFLGIEHVSSTTADSLMTTIANLFSRHGLSISSLRGQGYDGASNMRGKFNGLKTGILTENVCAHYVHCFAHQLQLALVAMASKHSDISWFFNSVTNIVNVAGSSCKRRDILREKQAARVIEALNCGDLSSGRGLNQETSLQRSSDTRWSSHYNTLVSLIQMFPSVLDVLEMIRVDGSTSEKKGEARGLLFYMVQFDFVFSLHLMRKVLAITNELSQALQRKDQDIVNAMNLVDITKQRLQAMRENGWGTLLDQISEFCGKHSLVVPNMDDNYRTGVRLKGGAQEVTNLFHFQVGLFNTVLDRQLQELNSRFNEGNTKLLLYMVCLSPNDSFSAFDIEKLIELAKLYPRDFSENDRGLLEDQLVTYIFYMSSRDEFSGLKGIGDLAQKMVQTNRHAVFPLVYKLLKLVLILPVATATVEMAFSAMKLVKSPLCNRMSD